MGQVVNRIISLAEALKVWGKRKNDQYIFQDLILTLNGKVIVLGNDTWDVMLKPVDNWKNVEVIMFRVNEETFLKDTQYLFDKFNDHVKDLKEKFQ